ncbi:AMP-binding protein [Deinococcus metallilatus]|uniref:Acyl-CoA synthetase (AMP-forming)/AMP-acid ligase II n=1 Tax=Deinococcus metallilatus TaxID=1211322 RepID=A0ABR6MV53_9DEIO|nr:AMP-binding protein [Deinococcus metallilatus]MBB5295800.1 acyl-CoA synthetase (AMP-forming)/AMP-acid ligase II [Deinococcus metallilatus]GMA14328.1 fatty-acyl-CoA synthase [Deinococcus metallilatus]
MSLLLDALRAVGRTGLLHPDPPGALRQWATLTARHGVSLYSVAAWSAARFPDAPALVEPEGSTTFGELVGQADLIADALAGWVGPGAAVGLLARNHATFVATLLACGRLGLRVVLLNTTFSAQQTLEVCRTQGLELLVVDDEWLPGLRERGTDLPLWPTSRVGALRREEVAGRPVRRGRGSIVILSSGSTGAPKAVRRSVNPAELLRTLTSLLDQLGLRARSPTLLTIPLFHGHGLMTLGLSLAMGAPLHLFARGTPEAYWRTLAGEGIEVLVLVPTVLYRLLETPHPGRAEHLRTIVCGSAPLSGDLATRALSRFGPVLYNLYGGSEFGLVSLATPGHLLAAPDSVGSVLPGVQVAIRRPDGTPAPFGEIGEVVVRGAMVQGEPGSALGTGDLGRLTPSGWLSLAGRRDDLLIIGGENVAPEAVEARIAELGYVRECAVVGLPSEEYGQALAALIVLHDGHRHVTRERVELDLRPLLPRMLRPASITFVEELPRNALGKLVRRRLKVEGGTEEGLGAAAGPRGPAGNG